MWFISYDTYGLISFVIYFLLKVSFVVCFMRYTDTFRALFKSCHLFQWKILYKNMQVTTVSAPSHVFHAIQFYYYFKLAEYIYIYIYIYIHILIINHFNPHINRKKKSNLLYSSYLN